MTTEPYLSAANESRFDFVLSECALPYAIFHVVYKDKWKHFNHVKVDLYSPCIDSSTERRSMIFFENIPDERSNYEFFAKQFVDLRSRSIARSQALTLKKNDIWLEKWEKIKEKSNTKKGAL